MGCTSTKVIENAKIKNIQINQNKELHEIDNKLNSDSDKSKKEVKINKEENDKNLVDKNQKERIQNENLIIKESKAEEIKVKITENREEVKKDTDKEEKNKIEKEIRDIKKEEDNSVIEKEREKKIESQNKEENIKKEEKEQIMEYEKNKKKLTGFLSGMKSYYILKDIFEYISYKKKLNLINHSKSFQKMFNITIKDYQELYLNDYISSKSLDDYLQKIYMSYNYDNDKNQRKELYEQFLSINKCDKNIIKEYIVKILKNKYNKNEGILGINIDINNPFFNFLSESKIMTGLFLPIFDDTFKNENLINDIKNFFTRLEEYPKIQLSLSFNSLTQVKLLSINFKKIKKFALNYPMAIPLLGQVDKPIEYFNIIKSFFEEVKNLEELTLSFILNTIPSESLGIINNFINLKNLQIFNVNLNGVLTLKLPNLKKLTLSNIKNIAFDENIIYNIEQLYIYSSKIINPKTLLKFPELKYIYNDSIELNSFLDLDTSKKLELISTTMLDFINLKISSINHLIVEKNNKEINLEEEKKFIEKILDLKNLESIMIKTNLNDEQIRKIKKLNLSVKTINFLSVNKIYINFLEKFPELNGISYTCINETENNILEIKENKDSKIDNITLTETPNGKLYCHSYESLKALKFSFYKEINNIEKIIPLFDYKCNVIFKSLRDFSLAYYNINDEFLNLLKTNLDFMPYLKNFTLEIKSNNISEIYYYDFIKKILSKNINNIKIELKDSNGSNLDYMTKQEIKKIETKVNYFYHEKLEISIFKK